MDKKEFIEKYNKLSWCNFTKINEDYLTSIGLVKDRYTQLDFLNVNDTFKNTKDFVIAYDLIKNSMYTKFERLCRTEEFKSDICAIRVYMSQKGFPIPVGNDLGLVNWENELVKEHFDRLKKEKNYKALEDLFRVESANVHYSKQIGHLISKYGIGEHLYDFIDQIIRFNFVQYKKLDSRADLKVINGRIYMDITDIISIEELAKSFIDNSEHVYALKTSYKIISQKISHKSETDYNLHNFIYALQKKNLSSTQIRFEVINKFKTKLTLDNIRKICERENKRRKNVTV